MTQIQIWLTWFNSILFQFQLQYSSIAMIHSSIETLIQIYYFDSFNMDKCLSFPSPFLTVSLKVHQQFPVAKIRIFLLKSPFDLTFPKPNTCFLIVYLHINWFTCSCMLCFLHPLLILSLSNSLIQSVNWLKFSCLIWMGRLMRLIFS